MQTNPLEGIEEELRPFNVADQDVLESNLSAEDEAASKLLQRDLIMAEIAAHPDMSLDEWVLAFSPAYRRLLKDDPDILRRYQDPASREAVIAEVRNRLSH
jgi:hypothetical protein